MADIKLTVAAENGVFELKPITMRLLGGEGPGNARLKRSQPVKRADLCYTLQRFGRYESRPAVHAAHAACYHTYAAMRNASSRIIIHSAAFPEGQSRANNPYGP